ncbi:hypothetical protein V2J09_005559 [Rumex salicifolius]
MGLNDSVVVVSENILMMKPPPKVDEAFSLLLHEDIQREVKSSSQTSVDSSAMNAKGGRSDGKPPLICTHCKRIGHSIDYCWQKNGIVPTKRPPLSCTHCKKTVAAQASTHDSTSSDQSAFSHGFSPDEFAQLKKLLSQSSTDSSEFLGAAMASIRPLVFFHSTHYDSVSSELVWIIDSGTSDHMCFSLSSFHKLFLLPKPRFISLPNNSRVYVPHFGSITMLSRLVLDHVLFVPSFKFDLLSISKLVIQTKSNVLFSNEHCVL